MTYGYLVWYIEEIYLTYTVFGYPNKIEGFINNYLLEF